MWGTDRRCRRGARGFVPPTDVDDASRTSDFAKQALTELRQSPDATPVAGARFWVAVQGGLLHADGKIDWDYTTVSHEMLQRALAFGPTTVNCSPSISRCPSEASTRPGLSARARPTPLRAD